MSDAQTIARLQNEVGELRRRLDEAEATLDAIRLGGVDAFVVEDQQGGRVLTLEIADRPYLRLVECMQEGALTLSSNGSILFCNERFADLVRCSTDSVRGKQLAEFFVDSAESVLSGMLSATSMEARRHELKLRRSSGEELPVLVAVSPLEEDEHGTFCAVVTDLTEKKYYEQLHALQTELSESEARLRLSLRAASAGTWNWDIDANQVSWSPENYELHGLPVGRPVDYEFWLSCVHPDDRPTFDATVRGSLASNVCDFRGEFRVVTSAGTRWLLAFGRVERSPSGQPIRMVGINLDITDRKLVEQALHDSDRRKDEFLATLAHELRNPLAPIRNSLQVMKLGGNSAKAVEQARTIMERQLAFMVRIIDDLLDVSRISQGKMELRKERVELAKVVQQAIETSRPMIESSEHELHVQLAGVPILVDADTSRLAQVFSNLLNNAAKYTERGGKITLSIERQGNEAVVSVQDNGVGIPANMLPHVFNMFTQVDRSLERSQGGLGIGLSLVKGLVEMHGGKVAAFSQGHGQGSLFSVRLPIAVSQLELNGDAHRGAAHSPLPRRRILVVDDNRDAASSLAMMLKMMGNVTQTAQDGLEAIELAATFHPDVVLLDIGMPRLNGYDTARRIRQEEWGKNAVLVAQTGWGQEEDKRKSRDAGFDFHMVKPIDPNALERLLIDIHERVLK